jgi:hypothetical protein
MKKTLFFFAALVLFFACTQVKDPSAATIEFSEPVASEADFIFSTCQGKKLIMTDAATAQKMSNNLKMETGGILSDLGVGNAFVLQLEGKKFLCTATHATAGLEKYIRKVGADIAVIDYDMMTRENPGGIQLTKSYDLDTVVRTGDSVFIRGYLFNKKGEIHSVVVQGAARLVDKSEYDPSSLADYAQYMQQRMLTIKLDENVELAGLSGSPAFNKQGKVVGVYSGRILEQNNGKDTYYIRISLFN